MDPSLLESLYADPEAHQDLEEDQGTHELTAFASRREFLDHRGIESLDELRNQTLNEFHLEPDQFTESQLKVLGCIIALLLPGKSAQLSSRVPAGLAEDLLKGSGNLNANALKKALKKYLHVSVAPDTLTKILAVTREQARSPYHPRGENYDVMPDPDARFQEVFKELLSVSRQLDQDRKNSDLIVLLGLQAHRMGRIVANNEVLLGASLSPVPRSGRTSEVMDNVIETLRDVPADPKGEDKWTCVKELATALQRFRRDGLAYPLGVASAKAGMVLLDDTTSVGLHARQTLTLLALPVLGRTQYFETLGEIRRLCANADRARSSELVATHEEFKLWDVDRLYDVALFNEATARASHIMEGDSRDRDADFQVLRELEAELEERGYDALELNMLKCIRVAVGRRIGVQGSERDAHEFWTSLGEKEAHEVYKLYMDTDWVLSVIAAVQESFTLVYPQATSSSRRTTSR